mgnify:CR=1 FL=1
MQSSGHTPRSSHTPKFAAVVEDVTCARSKLRDDLASSEEEQHAQSSRRQSSGRRSWLPTARSALHAPAAYLGQEEGD